MCMLIHHSKKSNLSRKMLANFLDYNPDGFGFAYGDGRKVHVMKVPTPDLKTVATLYDDFLRGREALIHFRMRTHGDVNEANTHPYHVAGDLWMAHNGVINRVPARRPEMSDTWHLIEDYIKPQLVQAPDLWRSRQWREMLGSFVGTNNRLAFVDRSGKVAVINAGSGLTFADTWFSNTYAWDPERFGAVKPAPKYGNYGAAYKLYTKADGSEVKIEGGKMTVAPPAYTNCTPGRVGQRVEEMPLSKRERKIARRAAALAARAKAAFKQPAKPGGARGLVLPADRPDVAIFNGTEFDRAWLRDSFRDAGIPMRGSAPLPPSDERTRQIAQQIILDDLSLRRDN